MVRKLSLLWNILELLGPATCFWCIFCMNHLRFWEPPIDSALVDIDMATQSSTLDPKRWFRVKQHPFWPLQLILPRLGDLGSWLMSRNLEGWYAKHIDHQVVLLCKKYIEELRSCKFAGQAFTCIYYHLLLLYVGGWHWLFNSLLNMDLIPKVGRRAAVTGGEFAVFSGADWLGKPWP